LAIKSRFPTTESGGVQIAFPVWRRFFADSIILQEKKRLANQK
jgi:hypothetical protein